MSETVTMVLTDFLLTRIAEDEAIARDVWSPGTWFDDTAIENGAYSVVMSPEGRVARLTDRGNAAHVARHDPARVLAECEAKRRILKVPALHCFGDPGQPISKAGWPVLAALALPYADHPDYREEWRP